MNTKKGFAPIIILLVVALAVAAVGYVLVRKPVGPAIPRKDDKVGVVTSAQTPSITVIAPNGGEKLEAGKPYIIRWGSIGIAARDMVQAWYERFDVTEANRPIGEFPNTGSAVWITPEKIDQEWADCPSVGAIVSVELSVRLSWRNSTTNTLVFDSSDEPLVFTGPCRDASFRFSPGS